MSAANRTNEPVAANMKITTFVSQEKNFFFFQIKDTMAPVLSEGVGCWLLQCAVAPVIADDASIGYDTLI